MEWVLAQTVMDLPWYHSNRFCVVYLNVMDVLSSSAPGFLSRVILPTVDGFIIFCPWVFSTGNCLCLPSFSVFYAPSPQLTEAHAPLANWYYYSPKHMNYALGSFSKDSFWVSSAAAIPSSFKYCDCSRPRLPTCNTPKQFASDCSSDRNDALPSIVREAASREQFPPTVSLILLWWAFFFQTSRFLAPLIWFCTTASFSLILVWIISFSRVESLVEREYSTIHCVCWLLVAISV